MHSLWPGAQQGQCTLQGVTWPLEGIQSGTHLRAGSSRRHNRLPTIALTPVTLLGIDLTPVTLLGIYLRPVTLLGIAQSPVTLLGISPHTKRLPGIVSSPGRLPGSAGLAVTSIALSPMAGSWQDMPSASDRQGLTAVRRHVPAPARHRQNSAQGCASKYCPVERVGELLP